MRVIKLQVRAMWYARKGVQDNTVLDGGKGRLMRCLASKMPRVIAVTRQGIFMIQTTSRRIPMWPAIVAVVTAPAVAAATATATAAAGFGPHLCEDIPLAQESPIPD